MNEENLDSVSMDRKTAEFVIRAERLKRTLTIFDAIRYLGMEDKVKTLETSSAIACPFHGQDSHPSATIYADSNMFFCHKCSSHPMDIIAFVSKAQGITKTQALDDLEEFAELPPMELHFKDADQASERSFDPPPPQDIKAIHTVMEDRIVANLGRVRGVANLSQYIKLWQYFDHLQFHFKDFESLTEAEYSEHLSALSQTLENWLAHGTVEGGANG